MGAVVRGLQLVLLPQGLSLSCCCCWADTCLQVRHVKRTALILPENYPSFTLLRQAIGAVQLGYEALTLLVPEVSSAPDCVAAPSQPAQTSPV